MINLVMVGTGAVAAEQTSYMKGTNYYNNNGELIQLKGYLEYDYNIEKYYKTYKFTAPILGDIDSYTIAPDDYFAVAISNVAFRKSMIDKLIEKNAKFTNLVHPTSIIADTSSMGIGNIIAPFCMLGPNSRIGNYNILTTQSLISHDSVIGDNNTFSTVILCGHTHVGDSNTFGIRSTVIPDVLIGDNCLIQAGMVVDKNIPDGGTVFYKYKERIIALPQ